MTTTSMSSLQEVKPLFVKKTPSGKLEVTLAFEVIFYFRGTASQHWPGIRAFYDAVLPLIRERMRYYVVDGRSGGQKIDGDTFDLLPSWASGQVAPRALYGLTLHAGASPEETCDAAFEFYASGLNPGFVRLLLPAEAGLDERAAELTRHLAGLWPWWIGMAGFAAPMRKGFDASSPTGPIAGLSRRFQGVDFGHPHLFARQVKEALKTVSWFSWVHKDLWTLKGGGELPAPDATGFPSIGQRADGVLVQASAFPQLGDVNRQETMDGYRASDRLLRPVRLTAEALAGYDGVAGEEATADWVERFEK